MKIKNKIYNWTSIYINVESKPDLNRVEHLM